MKRIVLAYAMFIAMLAIVLPAAAFAAPPDPSTNPVFAGLQASGAKFYYLGDDAGLNGWFIIKDGQVQILYATPDNRNALVGGLLGPNGENITVNQITLLEANNADVRKVISSAELQQLNSVPQVAGNVVPQMAGNAPVAVPAAAFQPPSPANAELAASSSTLSPGERLMHDLAGASGVVVGTPSSPEIMMVMNPDCPHCQATWKLLRDIVIKGSLHLRMIPIARAESDDERAGAILITSSSPLDAWDKYVAGDKSKLAGTPSMAALVGVRANHLLTDSWKIDKTPYLVYRAKNGKVKIVEGKPSELADILTDLGL